MDSAVQPQPEETTLTRLARSRWIVLLPFAYILGQFLLVYLGSEGLFERDGYYHARFANLLPSFGLSRDFHWTQFSTWNGQFCDKEFLFHVLMVPFTLDSNEPVTGAKVFGALLGCGVFLALFLVLRAHGARLPVLFTLLPLCMGATFLMRVLMIRSHVLSMLLLLIGMHFLLKQNWKALAALGFVYAWSYTFPLLLVMTAVPFAIGRSLIERKLDWKSPLAALGGVLAGLIIHPYSPHTLETFVTYLQVVAQGTAGVTAKMELGHEIYALSLGEMLQRLPLYCALTIALIGIALAARRKLSGAAMGALFAALFWSAMTLLYARFIEYSAPLTALAAGLVFRDLLGNVELRQIFETYRTRAAAAVVATIVVLAATHAITMTHVHEQMIAGASGPPYYRKARKWMDENLRPGDTVAHLWWEDFRDLYYDCYRQNFIWGLDPTYTLRYDATVARNLELMRTRQALINPHWIASGLKARVLVMLQPNAVQHPELTSSDWRPVYADETAVIFALEGPHAPPEELVARRRSAPLTPFPPTWLPLEGRRGDAR
ncbi:MAG TPA: hypothetical protein VEJ63_19790 [Planctomycetota bacterium]|nr:hypothetical protein [Planctomycetota bacterium]